MGEVTNEETLHFFVHGNYLLILLSTAE